jgi:simple sugar transport system ATP-binding protein
VPSPADEPVAAPPVVAARAAIELVSVTTRFGSVRACDGVSLSLRPGRIHGVLGQNGAGKSTLMRLLIGLVQPDEGEIRVDGRAVRISSPHVAAELGIGMVHQHFSLVDALTVWENVVLGDRAGRIDARVARRLVREVGERFGLAVDPDARVGSLSAGQRQRVEIVKCLRRNPRVLVLDEPTSVLTAEESEQLFVVLRRVVRDEGVAVALASHRLDEVLRATDEVVVLRDGRVAVAIETAATSADELAGAMVGEGVPHATARGPMRVLGATALRLDSLTVRSARRGVELDALTLEVRAGEIVGVAGAEGNGQHVLVDVLSSLRAATSGTVEVCGTAVRTGRAGAMGRAGVAVIPADRHDSGCILEMSVEENLVLASPRSVASRGVLDRAAMRSRAVELIAQYGISCPSPAAPLFTLSGGNQQRVVVARELSSQPHVLVAAQPARGLDVRAAREMANRLRATAESGTAIMLLSSELDELLDLSDRVIVLSRGRIVGEVSNDGTAARRIGLLIGGGT